MKSPELVLRWPPARKLRHLQVPVLWPVHVWPVVAPDRMPALNLFQSAILGLLRAGRRDLSDVAQLLDLDRDLVAFIVTKELQPFGWLDRGLNLDLTPEGLRVLDGEGGRAPRLTRQYAFQDALFGHWLPRLSANLPEVVVREGSEPGRPEFVLDRDSGWVERPFMLPSRLAPRGDVAEVRKAWVQHRRDRSRIDPMGVAGDVGAVDWGSDEIEFVGDHSRPLSAHIWCEVYANPDDPQPWLVSDPWRLVPAVKWLREPLQVHLSQFPELAGRMRRKLMPDQDTGSMSAAEWLAQLEHRAELELSSMPHLGSPEHALLREYMGRVIRQRDRLRHQDRVQSEDLNSLLTECGTLLEEVVKWMLKRWPIETRDWPSREWDRRLLGELLRALPLDARLSDASLKVLCGQKQGQTRLAIERRSSPFKALLVGTLLCTREHEQHPLRHLPARTLQWDRLLELTDLRNKGSHASGQHLDRHQSLDLADFAVAWHEQFIPYF